jgi:uncharacterized protein
MSKDIFIASSTGDLDFVKEAIKSNIDLSKINEFGFTALHCAAMGSNSTDPTITFEIIKQLTEAGNNIEITSNDGRTPLYLLAEFSPSIDPIQYLIEKGANPDVSDEYGNHITKNAMTQETQQLLSNLTNTSLENIEGDVKEVIKLKPSDWKKFKVNLSNVFKGLNSIGLIALENSGYTQSDAFEDCSELYKERIKNEKIKGFCFYTNQDNERAKEYGVLPLGIWGAPEGGVSDTNAIGLLVVEAFTRNGFEISWTGQNSDRPEVYLKNFQSSKKGLFGLFR